MLDINMIRGALGKEKCRSAWSRGVKAYVEELLGSLEENIDYGYVDIDDLQSSRLLEKALLNGASSWDEYSWGGCSLIYNYDIAERLCAPYELKLTKNGKRRPNKSEEWLDVQARALQQAFWKIRDAVNTIDGAA